MVDEFNKSAPFKPNSMRMKSGSCGETACHVNTICLPTGYISTSHI